MGRITDPGASGVVCGTTGCDGVLLLRKAELLMGRSREADWQGECGGHARG